jgi:hypothetical protein
LRSDPVSASLLNRDPDFFDIHSQLGDDGTHGAILVKHKVQLVKMARTECPHLCTKTKVATTWPVFRWPLAKSVGGSWAI